MRMTDQKEMEKARRYDEMIDWNSRLDREIPVIANYFEGTTVLDVACSSGRHSFALENLGFKTTGVDISEEMIAIAEEIREKKKSSAEFLCVDAASDQLVESLGGNYFDNALLLGNAIANMGSFENGKSLLRNIFVLLKPGGRFFTQTIHRPEKPWYNPLREQDGKVIQRIMIPVHNEEHNIELHVNVIDKDTLEYVQRNADNKFFMFTRAEFKQLVERIGFEIREVHKSYNMKEPSGEDGETLIWMIEKPTIELTKEGRLLFEKYAEMAEDEVKDRVLDVWQDMMMDAWYFCMKSYRFLHPRMISHPRYEEIIAMKEDEQFLDLACNTGTDLRQLVVDGLDPEKLMGIDQSSVFINAGFHIFNDRESNLIDFRVHDILDDDFLKFDDREAVDGEFLSFGNNFGAIHAGSLLHLLSRGQIRSIMQRVYFLLASDGIFFGRTLGKTTPEDMNHGLRYLHSKKSLTEALRNAGFEDVDVVIMDKKGPVGESSTDHYLYLMFYGRKPRD